MDLGSNQGNISTEPSPSEHFPQYPPQIHIAAPYKARLEAASVLGHFW